MVKVWIPPQGQVKSYGIWPPQGIKGMATPLPPVYGPPPLEPAPPNTVAACYYQSAVPHRNLVRVGGYWYAFYRRQSDYCLCYKSSADGSTWGSETQASHLALPSAAYYDYGVWTDGAKIYIGYPTGTYGTTDTATTLFTRRGTPSAGVITWDSAVQVFQCRGWVSVSFAQTASYLWVSFCYVLVDAVYRQRVYRSSDSGASWVLNYGPETHAAQKHGQAIVRHSTISDGLIMVLGKWADNTYKYKVYNGSAWDGSWSNVGEKTANQYAYGNSFSLCWANNEVHFAYLPYDGGGALRYRYFTSSWSAYTTVDSGTCLGPALSAHSDYLYVFYILSGGSDILYRKMVYATHTWDGSASTLASGETTPYYTNCEENPPIVRIGVVWISSGNMRFASL